MTRMLTTLRRLRRLLCCRSVVAALNLETPIAVEVRLLSGALNGRAQTALGVGKGMLVDSFGRVLVAFAPIWDSKLKNGDSLTLHLGQVQVCGAALAFATGLGDGTVVTSGDARYGGDSSAVWKQLQNVQHIQAYNYAFAAILGSGSVVTWDDARFGGGSRAVQGQLKGCEQIQASHGAFAAILGNGSLVTWGHADYGGQ